MVAISNEALEWLDRAEQAKEVAGQLTDPGARKAVLQVADTFDRLARAAAARKRELATKSEDRTHDFSRPSLIPTESIPWQEEQDGPAQRASDPRGTREDHRTSRLADRFVEQREATAEGQEERVRRLEAEIDDLLREKEEVEKWATVGSA
jgi:hypothetical protein